MCIRNLETVAHLFMECYVSRRVWGMVAAWARLSALAPQNWDLTESMQVWVLGMANNQRGQYGEAAKSMLILVIWELWRERNERVFRNTSRSVQQIVSSIQDEARLWASAGNKGLKDLLNDLELQQENLVQQGAPVLVAMTNYM